MPSESGLEPGSAGTLLIADDDPENREILRRLLEPRGFRLAFAVNGVETIARMEREDFDAVLLDIRMPEMDGFEVLSRLRETGRLGNTPVIVVTGLQEEQDAVRCIENGAEDFLSRPIRPALLMARLSASLEKKRLREKVFEQHFTPELARELARNPDPMKMQARQAEVSVMFCDIRGFSAVSERLGPAQTIAWLGGSWANFPPSSSITAGCSSTTPATNSLRCGVRRTSSPTTLSSPAAPPSKSSSGSLPSTSSGVPSSEPRPRSASASIPAKPSSATSAPTGNSSTAPSAPRSTWPAGSRERRNF